MQDNFPGSVTSHGRISIEANLDADLQFGFKGSNDPMAEGVKITSGPKPEDWDRLRPLICRLYFEEAMSLKDVAAIMRQEYDHKASESMYKKRFRKWGIEKYRRRQVTSRRKEQTCTTKTLPLQTKGWRLADERLDPRAGRDARQSLQSTAMEDSSYEATRLSGLPLPMNTIYEKPLEDEGTYRESMRELYSIEQRHSEIPTISARKSNLTRLKINRRPLGPTISRTQQLSPSNSTNVRFPPWHIPQVIAMPESLLVPERLLFSAKNFMQTSLDRFRTNSKGRLIPRELDSTQWTRSSSIFHFAKDVDAALSLLIRESFVEARQVLSRACESSKSVIEEGHPNILILLIFTYLGYKYAGFVDCAVKIIENLGCVARMIRKSSGIFDHVIRNLLLLDQNADGAYHAAWNCCEDILGQFLEPFHHAWLTSRLLYIQTVGSYGEWEKAEMLSRCLLTRSESFFGKTNLRYWLIQNSHAMLLFKRKKYGEAEDVAQHSLQCIEREQDADSMIPALYLLSRYQFQQSKYNSAEKNIRRCIRMDAEIYGKDSARNIQCSLKLETWLKRWGRHEEAAALAAQRSRILGSPIIKELVE